MKRYCIGVDIGGTSVKFGIFDMQGTLLEKWSIPTNITHHGIHILPESAASLNGKLEELGIKKEEVLGAGVGVPGQVVDGQSVLLAENLGWEHVPLAEELSGLTGLEVLAENDANVAALGEIWKGSAKRFHSMLLVTLGTGIGGGIVVQDKILSGAFGAAGEIGHIHIEDHMTERCNCGKYGCLEQLASASGIRRLGLRALENTSEPSLLRAEEVTAKTVFDAAKKQDPVAVRVVEQFGYYLGKALAICTCVLNPEVIVIGGGVSKAGDFLLDYIRKYYSQFAYPPCLNTEFRLAGLGSDAGIYGGAKLILGNSEYFAELWKHEVRNNLSGIF